MGGASPSIIETLTPRRLGNYTNRSPDLTRREIREAAAEIRAARQRETHFYADGTAAVEYAAAVLSLHARSLKSWSNLWQRSLSRCEYLEMLGHAMLAQAFLMREGRELLNLDCCCRLLRTDPEDFRSRVIAECTADSWCWLVGLRALELLNHEPAEEPEVLVVPELQQLERVE